jgi:hypothetical protein
MTLGRKRGFAPNALFAAVLTLGLMVSLTVACGSSPRVTRLDLMASDIAYNPHTQTLYASVPSSVGVFGNTVTAIDPFTGEIVQSIQVGPGPGKLAISDNGRYLYVALNSGPKVVQWDLQTNEARAAFTLESSFSNDAVVGEDIEVLPGNPESVAVTLMHPGRSPKTGGVVIYDNGVPRPVTIPERLADQVLTACLEAG